MAGKAQRVFVISDLHLGGKQDFQICGPKGQDLLAGFIGGVTATHSQDVDAHLVLAGDVVDFLAEEPFTLEMPSDAVTSDKLARIFERTAPIWDALHKHVAAGAPLTVMLGNHDIEATLPATRRMLLSRLGVGRVEFLYDNETLSIGKLLIEHGNRYDGWNWVDHDALRQVRSSLSRGETPLPFEYMPGSQMVIQHMNPLKAKYGFIDLLKPEGAAMQPFLLLLAPRTLWDLRKLWDVGKLATARMMRSQGGPRAASRGPGDEPRAPAAEHDDEMRALLDEVARLQAPPPEGERGLVENVGVWVNSMFAPESRARGLRALYRALQPLAGEGGEAFDLEVEVEPYATAAQASFKAGYKVVVYGHTHLVKRVDVGDARYLNCGTWADLMRVPDSILTGTEDEALKELDRFAEDLAKNDLDAWRRQAPTFARIDIGPDLAFEATDANVYLYEEGADLLRLAPLPDGRFLP